MEPQARALRNETAQRLFNIVFTIQSGAASLVLNDNTVRIKSSFYAPNVPQLVLVH